MTDNYEITVRASEPTSRPLVGLLETLSDIMPTPPTQLQQESGTGQVRSKIPWKVPPQIRDTPLS